MMTLRERFLAFAGFGKVDRVPRCASFTPELQERMSAFLGADPHVCFAMDSGGGHDLRPPEGFVFPDYRGYHPDYREGEGGFYIDGIGCGHLHHGFHHFTEYISPLRKASTLAEIENYPIVSNETFLDDRMREACAQAHREGRFADVFVGHMYENAWQVRGYEAFLEDLLLERDRAELLLERFCQNNVRTAAAAARAGYDCIRTGDDVATQQAMIIHPDLWRALMKPRWARVIEAARNEKPDIHVWYHSDGNILDIIDDLVEIGVTILNPVQPECMDPVAVRRRFGKRLAFDGCVGTQTTFPFGTPAQMRQTVTELATRLDGLHGGLLLAPTHVLEPEVPPENVVAFFEACDALVFPA